MKRKKPSKPSPSFGNPEILQIEQLFQFMTEHNLEEFEYSRGDLSIRLRKPSAGPEKVASAPDHVPENPSCQSRGNRPAGHLCLQRIGDIHCCGLLRSGP